MNMNQRVKELRNQLNLNRSEFAKEIGLKPKTIDNIENERQKLNSEHIEAITERYPEYVYWLITGLELPESGQISPVTEELRKKLKEA